MKNIFILIFCLVSFFGFGQKNSKRLIQATPKMSVASPLTGDGTAANPVVLTQAGLNSILPIDLDPDPTNELELDSLALTAQPNEVVTWDGTAWITAKPSEDADADPTNEIQTLAISGNNLTILGANTVTLPITPADGDGDSSNEIQTISVVGNEVRLSGGGGSAILPASPAEIDGSVTNEIQSLSISGNDVSLSNGGGTITLPIPAPDGDGSSTNELQTITSIGGTVTLSNGGGSFQFPVELDGDDTNELQGLTLSGNTLGISGGNTVTLPIAPEIDGSITNELQTLSVTGASLSISQGNTVILPVGDCLNNTISIPTQTLTASGNVDFYTVNIKAGKSYQATLNTQFVGSVATIPCSLLVVGTGVIGRINGTHHRTSAAISTIANNTGMVAIWNSTNVSATSGHTVVYYTLSNPTAADISVTFRFTATVAAGQNVVLGANSVLNIQEVGCIGIGQSSADTDPANELQSLSITGNNLTLSNNGGTVAVPVGGNVIAMISNATPTAVLDFDNFRVNVPASGEMRIATISGTRNVGWLAEQEYPGGSFSNANGLTTGTPYALTTTSIQIGDNATVPGERVVTMLHDFTNNAIYRITTQRLGLITGNWHGFVEKIGITTSQIYTAGYGISLNGNVFSDANTIAANAPLATAQTGTTVNLGELTFRYGTNVIGANLEIRSVTASTIPIQFFSQEEYPGILGAYGSGTFRGNLTANSNVGAFLAVNASGLDTDGFHTYKIATANNQYIVYLSERGGRITIKAEKAM